MREALWYVLIDKTPYPVRDIWQWSNFYANFDNRKVAFDSIGGIDISTVFLGLDHGWSNEKPVLFETMIFGGDDNEKCFRCCTWEEAELMHKKAVEMVRASFG